MKKKLKTKNAKRKTCVWETLPKRTLSQLKSACLG